jgi:hypothetical protein
MQLLQFQLALFNILVQRTLFGVGTLGKITAIIGMIAATVTEIFIFSSPMQRNTGVSVSF